MNGTYGNVSIPGYLPAGLTGLALFMNQLHTVTGVLWAVIGVVTLISAGITASRLVPRGFLALFTGRSLKREGV